MNPTLALRISALMGLLAVALGAFGAHGFKHILEQNHSGEIWKTAVLYHFIHAVMLFVLASRKTLPRLSWFAFLAGILIFSGSLYCLALTDLKWLGAVTPFGGASFIVGWTCLILSARRFTE